MNADVLAGRIWLLFVELLHGYEELLLHVSISTEGYREF